MAKDAPNSDSISNPPQCARCPLPSAFTLRLHPLCPTHITQYIHTKTIKRLETFRTRYSSPNDPPRRLLLALSFGVSSTSLLQILDWHLAGQRERVGRAGVEVRVVWVRGFNEVGTGREGQGGGEQEERLERLRERYPAHAFETLELASVLDLIPGLATSLPPDPDLDASVPASQRLDALLTSLPSASSRADLKRTLLHRLLLHHASATSCSALLYGSTTTLLAERTLAEVASGKGFALPQLITDTPASPSEGGVQILHPLRDVLRKEIQIYASLVAPPLAPLLLHEAPVGAKAVVNSRDATIEGLMRGYFEGVEEGFPAVVSNVVRTVGKLQAQPQLSRVEKVAECGVCGLAFVQEGEVERSRVCGGCARMLGGVAMS
ncbi:Cytoplasmic tRNA 2-thiolation protein 2 [Oleoguttula sp. CCFEE 5521]